MRAVVTGAGGFVGGAVARQLLTRGDEVVALSRGHYPALEALGAESAQVDLTAPEGLDAAIAGADVVFHVAAKTGVWGSRESFWSINVDGTQRLLDAARRAGVGRFVFTSSPSATFDGLDADGLTEADCPYPDQFESFYPESKAEAERRVLDANDEHFATTALRPHLVWGPGDPHLLPRLISRRKQGRLAIVGDGTNRVDLTYVDNAAAAHLQACDALATNSANAGKAYFVTDGSPVVLWEWLNGFLEAVGLEPVSRRVSLGTARRVGSVLEQGWRWFGLGGEPPMTRFVAAQLATAHWYDLTAAREDFGYAPVVSPEQAYGLAVAYFRDRVDGL